MEDHYLSFELNESKDELDIHGDEKGLQLLISALTKLLVHTPDGYFDHDHLMTQEWGGYELSSKSKGGIVLNHVKIYCWKGNSVRK